MDWTPLAADIQNTGICSPYLKHGGAQDFVSDYKRLIDFAARANLTGVIIYGFLRDSHGGIAAAKEVCDYGKAKGVGVMPGVGINSYGGIYYEGNHPYNLTNWLDKHPELAAVGEKENCPSGGWKIACPSKPENVKWHKEAIAWLTETFEIAGINFETGDYGICQCKACKKKGTDRTGSWSIGDMARDLPQLMNIATKIRPNLLPLCECYFDNLLDAEQFAPLAALPPAAILQFTVNGPFWEKRKQDITREAIARLPPHRKILRTHMGSQWTLTGERHGFRARTFWELVRTLTKAGFDGVTIFGEVSAESTVNEINYLSLTQTALNPALTWEAFVRDHLGPLLGGADLAQEFVELLEARPHTDAHLKKARTILASAGEPAYRRWLWMVDHLYKCLEVGA
jgi:hypothetical protein